jgi:hypothetical protein
MRHIAHSAKERIMKQRICRICFVVAVSLIGIMGTIDSLGGTPRRAYAADPTATPTQTPPGPNCASIGCGG